MSSAFGRSPPKGRQAVLLSDKGYFTLDLEHKCRPSNEQRQVANELNVKSAQVMRAFVGYILPQLRVVRP